MPKFGFIYSELCVETYEKNKRQRLTFPTLFSCNKHTGSFPDTKQTNISHTNVVLATVFTFPKLWR